MVETTSNEATPSRYLRELPAIYHGDSMLDRFLRGFEEVLGPREEMVDSLPYYFEPRLTTPDMLRWLAQWVGLELDESWSMDTAPLGTGSVADADGARSSVCARDVVPLAMDMHRWRGTRQGLIRTVALYTGGLEAEIEVLGTDRFRAVLRVPRGQDIHRSAIDAVIRAEKPAHTTYELELIAED